MVKKLLLFSRAEASDRVFKSLGQHPKNVWTEAMMTKWLEGRRFTVTLKQCVGRKECRLWS